MGTSVIKAADSEKLTKRVRNRSFAIGLVVGAAAMLVLTPMVSGSSSPQATTTVTVTAQPGQAPSEQAAGQSGIGIDLARRTDGDVTAMGSVDAPVVMIAYADYRCPFCALFEQTTLPTIVSEYVDQGLVRFEYRDMPVFGDQSVSTAVAGRAAGNQGMFWEFMSAIAANGVTEGGHPDLPRERLIAFAEQAGVPDIAQFTADLDDPNLLQTVQTDLAEGKQLGVTSVPTFIIGDTPVVGAQPLEVFTQVIDKELSEVGVIR